MRPIDLSCPHNTNTQDGALLFALRILAGASSIWEPLKQLRPTDAELSIAIEAYFPESLGYHSERQKGFYIGRNPEPFFVWGNTVTASNCVTGPALLRKVRAVLCLQDRSQ